MYKNYKVGQENFVSSDEKANSRPLANILNLPNFFAASKSVRPVSTRFSLLCITEYRNRDQIPLATVPHFSDIRIIYFQLICLPHCK